MKLLAKVWLLVVVIIAATQSISAAEWRGIVPLHSSRTDIVGLFNECGDNKQRCFFSLEDQEVQVVFSGWQRAFNACPKSVPKDTVLLVRVRVKKQMLMKDLQINLRTFKAFDPSSPSGIGYRAYIDEKSGLLILFYKGRVVEFDYIATREDQARCPWFYDSPRDFVLVVPQHLPPTIVVACRQDDSGAGSRAEFFATTTEDYDSLIWTVTDGTILSGQGTREITVDTRGLAGRKITATVEMTVENDPGWYRGSCEVQIPAKLAN